MIGQLGWSLNRMAAMRAGKRDRHKRSQSIADFESGTAGACSISPVNGQNQPVRLRFPMR